MKYKANPYVVKTRICGVSALVPLRAASETCRSVKRLAPLWAMTWDSLSAGHGLEDQIMAHKIITKLPEETIRPRVDAFIQELVSKGFLIEEEE